MVERLAQARQEPALQVASTLAATLGRLPTRLLLPALHAQADSVDFAATALPGLPGQRHLCGSLIEGSYPLGPRLGCPMNITAFGNEDRLDIGIAIDVAEIEQVLFRRGDEIGRALRSQRIGRSGGLGGGSRLRGGGGGKSGGERQQGDGSKGLHGRNNPLGNGIRFQMLRL